jgi:ribosome-associated heat shock protein Hsp15
VRVNGVVVKASAPVRVGDRVEARLDRRERVVEVVRLVTKRVGAPVAAECLVDHTPPPTRDDDVGVPRRAPGTGRPTKRDRRRLDDLRGR